MWRIQMLGIDWIMPVVNKVENVCGWWKIDMEDEVGDFFGKYLWRIK